MMGIHSYWRDDLIGTKVGDRVILGRAPNRGSKTYCRVRCSCGRENIVRLSGIRPKCRSCAITTHGLSRSALRRCWAELRDDNLLCKEWLDWDVFLEYVGRDNLDKRVVRQDRSRNYEPGNIMLKERRWRQEQT
jgi:hypothetical protein